MNDTNTIEPRAKASVTDVIIALVLLAAIALVFWMGLSEGEPWDMLIKWTLAAAVSVVVLSIYAERYLWTNDRFKLSIRLAVSIMSLLTGWYANSETTAQLHSLLPVGNGDASSAMMTGRFLYFCGALVLWLPILTGVAYVRFLFVTYHANKPESRPLPYLKVPRRRITRFIRWLREVYRFPCELKHMVLQFAARIARVGLSSRLALLWIFRRLSLRIYFVGVIFVLALALCWSVAVLVGVARTESLVSAVMSDVLYAGDAYDASIFPCNKSVTQWIEREAAAGRHWKGFRQGAQDVLFVSRRQGPAPKKPYWRFSEEELENVTQFDMVVRRCFEPASIDQPNVAASSK